MTTAMAKWSAMPTSREPELTSPAMSGKKLTCSIHWPNAQPPALPASPPATIARARLNGARPGRPCQPQQERVGESPEQARARPRRARPSQQRKYHPADDAEHDAAGKRRHPERADQRSAQAARYATRDQRRARRLEA